MKMTSQCFALIALLLVVGQIAQGASFTKRQKKTKIGKRPQPKTATDLTVGDLILHGHQYDEDDAKAKSFPNAVFGFVTPWNNHGYDVAKKFIKKFTHISPVWYEFDKEGKVHGAHDRDDQWLSDLRSLAAAPPSSSLKIVPRVALKDFSVQDYNARINDPSLWTPLVDSVLSVAADGFDGVTIDLGFITPGVIAIFAPLLEMVRARAGSDFELIVTLKPPNVAYEDLLYTDEDMAYLLNVVSYVFLEFYDHQSIISHSQPDQKPQAGPNAPISWILQNMMALIPPSIRGTQDASRIIIGCNMYGRMFSDTRVAQAVTASELLSLFEILAKTSEMGDFMKWDDSVKENVISFLIGDEANYIFFPTTFSMKERMDLAESMGASIGFWEIGQAFDSYYAIL